MEVVKPKVATPKMEAKKAATPKIQPKAAAADEDDDQEEEEEEEDEEEARFVFWCFFRISFAENRKRKQLFKVWYLKPQTSVLESISLSLELKTKGVEILEPLK